jgi:hypothetical protein
MDAEKLKRLRAYYRSLCEQKQFLDKLHGGTQIRGNQIYPLIQEIDLLANDFPDMVPFESTLKSIKIGEYYDFIGLRGLLARVLGRLEVEIDQPTDTPITEKRQFNFINDSNLRSVVERDYYELQRAFLSNCWKSVIILSGGLIEAILTDLLLTNKSAATSAKSAPNKPDITQWDLSDLINVSVELKLVSSGMQKLSHPLREYRNLVHPGNEIRKNLTFDAEEAKIAIEVLHILHRDLSH